ncbi:carbohydrate sulfotransferase 11-like [Macrobrachium rosenbergii]|uniref:carbohydrate sulfotransferase 11-like n=1 Tax=Macrobrachium rosenbergii TaxID=79674 RepID=UPI0034D751BC
MGGRASQRNVLLSAVTIYVLLALTTDIFENVEPKKDVFKLEKLPLRPSEEIQLVEFQRRKTRVKEVCTAWGAYTTKAKFLKIAQKPSTDTSKADDELTRDRKEFSQSQLERIWQLSKRTTFHQMFVDRAHSLTWCKVPKAASTSWLHAFLELAGVNDVASKDMAGKHALLREKYPLLTNSLLKRIMPTSMKFMVVRHPFERILSAYRDKLENSERDLKDRGGYYYAIYGKRIVKAYRKSSSGSEFSSNERKEPTFREFIQYLLDTDVEEYDEHWKPIFLLCTPCHIRYDVIAKMETLAKDAEFILYHRGLSGTVNIEWSHKTDQSKKTTDVLKSYYSQLTSSEIKQLYYKYLPDFLMFEYDAEPYLNLMNAPKRNETLTINGGEENDEYYGEEDEEEEEEYYDEEEEEEDENYEENEELDEDAEENYYENYTADKAKVAEITGNEAK